MLIRKSRFVSLQAAVLFSLVGGCADEGTRSTSDQQSAEFETDPAQLQAALESPIASCQQDRIKCRRDADSADARATCNDTLASCLQTAADKAQKIANGIRKCREEALSCAGDRKSGSKKIAACRDDYDSCTQAAIDGSDSTDASTPLPTVDAGTSTSTSQDAGHASNGNGNSNGNGSALPSLPSVDGGIAERLPKPLKCVVEMRQCVLANRSAANDCADQAQTCMRAR